jgi:membrane protein YqaA with SNARE-associated domain
MGEALAKIAAILTAYGPWGVLLLSALDSVGIPMPAAVDALVITIAASSAKEPGVAWLTALMATIGSIGGNIVLFYAARHGRRFFTRPETPAGKRRRFQEWFQRYGLMTVFIPGLLPVPPLPLKVFVISAGACGTSFGKFIILLAVARAIRYFGEAWLGLQLGADAHGFLIRNGWTMAAIAVALTVGMFLALRRLNQRPPEAVAPGCNIER